MAKELLPDALWARIAPLPKGGRPRVSDRAALTGILFVLKTGRRASPGSTCLPRWGVEAG